MKTSRTFNFLALVVIMAFLLTSWLGFAQKSEPAKPKLAVAIKPQHVADALHALIASDREVYTQIAAQHQGDPQISNPCEMFRLSSEATASKGVEFSYVLRALKPVNLRNAPETEAEKKGLELISAHPNEAFYAEEMQGGRWYFTAVYPDVAVKVSCVNCHNQHPKSPRTDFKTGDVLGGVVVRVALEL